MTTVYHAQNGLWVHRSGTLDPGVGTTPELPGGLGVPSSTLWGMGSFKILANNTAPELDIYRNKNIFQVFDYLQTEYAALAGATHTAADPFMQCVRTYDGGFPATFQQHEANTWMNGRGPLIPVLSTKADDNQISSGSLDAEIATFVQSCPSDRTVYWIMNHERDNDTDALANPTTVMAEWRDGIARWSREVLEANVTYGRTVIPGVAPTGWNLQEQNNDYDHEHLNVAPELTALGVDLDDFVYWADSYQRNQAEATGFTRVTQPIAELTRSWGFVRFGLAEVAVDSYGTATRGLADDYLRNMGDVVHDDQYEAICWYQSGGGNSAPAQGWWIYGSGPKTAWANNVAGNYPALAWSLPGYDEGY